MISIIPNVVPEFTVPRDALFRSGAMKNDDVSEGSRELVDLSAEAGWLKSGNPKWIVSVRENPTKMDDDWGVRPHFKI